MPLYLLECYPTFLVLTEKHSPMKQFSNVYFMLKLFMTHAFMLCLYVPSVVFILKFTQGFGRGSSCSIMTLSQGQIKCSK